MMAATLLCRPSHLWFPSWTMRLRAPAASVRFSRASRRNCLFSSSSWVRRSWTCRWKACEEPEALRAQPEAGLAPPSNHPG